MLQQSLGVGTGSLDYCFRQLNSKMGSDDAPLRHGMFPAWTRNTRTTEDSSFWTWTWIRRDALYMNTGRSMMVGL
jgi:hypothetical protein